MNKYIISIVVLALACFHSTAFAGAIDKKFNLAKVVQNLDEDGDPGLYRVTIVNLAPGNADKYKFKLDTEVLEYDDLPKPDTVTVPFKKKSTANGDSRKLEVVDCKPLEEAVDALIAATDESKIESLIDKSSFIDGCGEQNTRAAAAINSTKVVLSLYLLEGTKKKLAIERDNKSWTYSIRSDLPGKFVANWGIAVLPNNDEDYFSSANGEGSFVITEKNTSGITIIPSVFYTYVPDFDPSDEIVDGYSLGLGLDQDNLSAFAGYNWTYRTKLGLTIGVAAHKQKRLLGEYKTGQQLAENVETLTENTYQLNLFAALVYGF